ncbi:type IV toxin-antitoxin system AbiEi family antitoxin domain-containing protein [Nocardia colli]|uniref:Type IV toxin-antitoxin system AbiEi family antitoxin domain-containing protein n=1 Tax=Nocardia colli TaxID=2545717 RepID=A0A5N0ED33_9NOCA|nr:type IV toxin-antitoxin system AbiEi family antitoxin domain-containing protein [Nocardia colli]KAA8886690.1 type IV toxin-antitoxin system AbiEi family antitoxin domain-containing protein [Nocardia colli]
MSDEQLLDLADLAEGQWGLLTTGQAVARGVTPMRLKRYADRGVLVRLRHGVYRLAGAPESPLEALRAEWLALEPKRGAADRLNDPVPVGVVSHRSAAALQDLGDLDADVHTFTVPRRRNSSRTPELSFRVGTLERSDWHRVQGLPVTRPLRTVVDLAAAHTDGGHLATVVRDAILSGDTTSRQVADALRPYAHRYGQRPGDGAGLVRDFIVEAGIPASAIDMATIHAAMPSMPSTQLDGINAAAISALTSTPEWADLLAEIRDMVARNFSPTPNLAAEPAAVYETEDRPAEGATSNGEAPC